MKIYDSTLEEYNNVLQDIKDSEITGNYIITGSLGLWFGRRQIIPVGVFNTPYEAIMECCGSSDDLRIYTEAYNKLLVEAIHHDGVNKFEIRQLNTAGLKQYDNGLSIDTIVNERIDTTKNCGKLF